jgi:predicted NUDIX family NTP pyrophosphohydrolase
MQLHPAAAAGFVTGNIDGDVAGRADLVINFPGAGVWAFVNNAAWVQLHGLNAPVIATGDIDGNGQADVILSFPGFGIWVYRNQTTWMQVHGFTPEAFVAGRLNAN